MESDSHRDVCFNLSYRWMTKCSHYRNADLWAPYKNQWLSSSKIYALYMWHTQRCLIRIRLNDSVVPRGLINLQWVFRQCLTSWDVDSELIKTLNILQVFWKINLQKTLKVSLFIKKKNWDINTSEKSTLHCVYWTRDNYFDVFMTGLKISEIDGKKTLIFGHRLYVSDRLYVSAISFPLINAKKY